MILEAINFVQIGIGGSLYTHTRNSARSRGRKLCGPLYPVRSRLHVSFVFYFHCAYSSLRLSSEYAVPKRVFCNGLSRLCPLLRHLSMPLSLSEPKHSCTAEQNRLYATLSAPFKCCGLLKLGPKFVLGCFPCYVTYVALFPPQQA